VHPRMSEGLKQLLNAVPLRPCKIKFGAPSSEFAEISHLREIT
jgi:hypothetical protein